MIARKTKLTLLGALSVCAGLLAAQVAFFQRAPVIISSAGIGGVSAETPFTEKAIKAALPGFSVHKERWECEVGYCNTIVASTNGGDKKTITFYGNGTVTSGEVTDPSIVTDHGIAVGAVFDRVYSDTSKASCKPGMEALSGEAVCAAPDEKNISLMFTGDWGGPDGSLPPLKKIEHWTIESMVWNAPS